MNDVDEEDTSKGFKDSSALDDATNLEAPRTDLPQDYSKVSTMTDHHSEVQTISRNVSHQFQPNSSSTIQPIRNLEEDGSNVNTSNSEFHQVERTPQHLLGGGPLSRSAPSKWNDAEKWIDHLALMMELLGKMPRKIATSGSRSKEYFDRHGDLKRIRRLKFWPLDRLLVEKYKFSESDAREFADFLCPLLDFAPEKRPTAGQCLQHPWLRSRDAQPMEENKEASVEKLEIGVNKVRLGRGM